MGKEEFMKKFAEDKGFAEKVLGLRSLDDAKALIASEGFEFSDEQVSAFLDGLKKLISSSMSDEDLDLAVGGFASNSGLMVGSEADSFREGLGTILADADGFRAGSGLR